MSWIPDLGSTALNCFSRRRWRDQVFCTETIIVVVLLQGWATLIRENKSDSWSTSSRISYSLRNVSENEYYHMPADSHQKSESAVGKWDGIPREEDQEERLEIRRTTAQPTGTANMRFASDGNESVLMKSDSKRRLAVTRFSPTQI